VKRRGDDDLIVFHAGCGEHLEQNRQGRLPNIGPKHLRQRQRDVVDGDSDLHPRPQQRAQRVHPLGMIERVTNRRRMVPQARDRRFGVDDARPRRQLDPQQIFA